MQPSPNVTDAEPPLPDHRRILCFGDSNTWGFNPNGSGRIADGLRWPQQLAENLHERRPAMQWHVIEEGLNSRTWLLDDPIGAARYGADYSCSGRSTLMTSLHSHKPLDTVVLALGCNDCKAYLNLAAEQITTGAQILIHDIRRAHDCGPRAMPKQSPAIILMTPPAIQITPQSLAWGFDGADEKSIALAELYRQLAAEMGVIYFNVQTVASPSQLDGVHFDCSNQALIADALAELIAAKA